MPLLYGDPRPAPRRESAKPLVAILGGTRREKGSYRIREIIRACGAQVEFLVHLTNNDLSPEDVERLARIREEPGVTVIDDALPLPAYEAALNSADLALFPYETIPYRKRTSGVFGEAVAFGKPVVVSPGTWMAEQVAAGRAAGVIAGNVQPESFARAVAHCVANLATLTQSARAVSAAWRKKMSLPAFVDQVEAEIARRAQTEKPARRWWWPSGLSS
jgi:glycosyltransferase involved in cell wall biosynthesis